VGLSDFGVVRDRSPKSTDIRKIEEVLSNENSELNEIAQKFQLRPEDHVFRNTLDRHLAQDITQECLLEMVKIFGTSRNMRYLVEPKAASDGY
jgi:hypothetical protein